MRLFAAVAALVFAYSAAVQVNDPDPVRWLLLYGTASSVCALHAVTRVPRWVPWTLAAVAIGWAATILPSVAASADFTGNEGERELAGLLLVAAAGVVLGRRRSAS